MPLVTASAMTTFTTYSLSLSRSRTSKNTFSYASMISALVPIFAAICWLVMPARTQASMAQRIGLFSSSHIECAQNMSRSYCIRRYRASGRLPAFS